MGKIHPGVSASDGVSVRAFGSTAEDAAVAVARLPGLGDLEVGATVLGQGGVAAGRARSADPPHLTLRHVAAEGNRTQLMRLAVQGTCLVDRLLQNSPNANAGQIDRTLYHFS